MKRTVQPGNSTCSVHIELVRSHSRDNSSERLKSKPKAEAIVSTVGLESAVALVSAKERPAPPVADESPHCLFGCSTRFPAVADSENEVEFL